MLTKDYIMRMIDSLVKMLARLVFLKQGKNFEEAFKEIDQITREIFGLDRMFINSISDSQLIKMIGNSESLLAPNCYLLGVLFNEEAEIYALQKLSEKSFEMYERSLNLFVEGLKNYHVLIEPDHLNKIHKVVEKIEDREINIKTEESLFYYYEYTGKFDKAEDLIFDLIDYDSKYYINGINFYKRLLDKPDNVLIKGNLPRQEVEEGIELLIKKQSNPS